MRCVLTLPFCCPNDSFFRECMHNPFCVGVFVLVKREEFYFLRSFNPAPKQTMTQPIRREIWRRKFHLLRQFVDFVNSNLSLILTRRENISCSNGEQKREESIVSVSFSFRQMCWRVYSARLSRTFSWFPKVRQVLYMYFAFIPDFRVVKKWTNAV